VTGLDIIKIGDTMASKKEMDLQNDVWKMCLCPGCPTWVECGEKGGFCLATIGKSKCIKVDKGCICGSCPVTQKLGLTHWKYCIMGSEKEQLKQD